MRDILKRGIGVHHSGILPIMKEVWPYSRLEVFLVVIIEILCGLIFLCGFNE